MGDGKIPRSAGHGAVDRGDAMKRNEMPKKSKILCQLLLKISKFLIKFWSLNLSGCLVDIMRKYKKYKFLEVENLVTCLVNNGCGEEKWDAKRVENSLPTVTQNYLASF